MNIYKAIILLLFMAKVSFAQQSISTSVTEGEVGIIEHLDSIIPLDLKFKNEKDELVSLRSLIISRKLRDKKTHDAITTSTG